MSILIKDMEMPTSCGDCPIGDSLRCSLMPGVPALWAEYASAVKEKRLHSDCPLVPVPPHGRLIDADELLQSNKSAFFDIDGYPEFSYEAVIDAPTIIPASEEGE